jgi:hypothetical protein
MSNIGIANTNTNAGQVSANVTARGPMGIVGDMKANPIANPKIPRSNVSSTQNIRRETMDTTDMGTKAVINTQEEKGKSSDVVDQAVAKAVISHNAPINTLSGENSNTNPSETVSYGTTN